MFPVQITHSSTDLYLCVPSPGERPGGKPGRNRTQIHGGDGSSAGVADSAGGRVVAAAFGHATQQDGVRAAAAHQTESGDGDRHLQEAAGGRGNVGQNQICYY